MSSEEAKVIRMFTTDREWVQVVNHDWDVSKFPPYDPSESPAIGDLRALGSTPNPYRSHA